MRGEQHHRVCRDQRGGDQIDRVTRRSVGDRGMLGLLLIIERERAAARPSAEDDFGIAEPRFEIGDARAQIEHAFFHDQRGIVAPVARIAIDDMAASMRQRGDQRQKCAATNRVAEQDHAVTGFGRMSIIGADAHAFDKYLAGGAAINLFQAAMIGMEKAIRFAHHAHRKSSRSLGQLRLSDGGAWVYIAQCCPCCFAKDHCLCTLPAFIIWRLWRAISKSISRFFPR